MELIQPGPVVYQSTGYSPIYSGTALRNVLHQFGEQPTTLIRPTDGRRNGVIVMVSETPIFSVSLDFLVGNQPLREFIQQNPQLAKLFRHIEKPLQEELEATLKNYKPMPQLESDILLRNFGLKRD